MRIAITGSSGFIGSALVVALRAAGHEPIPIVRRAPKAGEVEWDPDSGRLDPAKLEGVDAAVNLAGEKIAGRWTADKKQRIRESRLRGTKLLVDTLSGLNSKPSVLLSASAVGIYGDRGDEVLTESSPPGAGFLAELGVEWEAEANRAAASGIRVVNPRLGIVLDKHGGALKEMLRPFRMGVGGVLGSGRQYMSWIALEDTVRAFLHLLENQTVSGPVNVAAANPCTNRDFTKALGSALHRPTLIPVPPFALRMLFGEMADEALLASVRVMPARLHESGFHFNHPDVQSAIRDALA